MINKKIVLSVLVLGFLAVGGAFATWAYFQEIVTSTGNAIGTATIDMKVNDTDAKGSNITFSGVTIANAFPGQGPVTLQLNPIENTGSQDSSNIDVYAMPKNISGNLSDSNMAISVGDTEIIYGSGHITSPTMIASNMAPGDISSNGVISYTYTDSNANQNQYQGQDLTFDVEYIGVPHGANVSSL
jgi:spore coat-associated protein N